jgi:hypothetical protein
MKSVTFTLNGQEFSVLIDESVADKLIETVEDSNEKSNRLTTKYEEMTELWQRYNKLYYENRALEINVYNSNQAYDKLETRLESCENSSVLQENDDLKKQLKKLQSTFRSLQLVHDELKITQEALSILGQKNKYLRKCLNDNNITY